MDYYIATTKHHKPQMFGSIWIILIEVLYCISVWGGSSGAKHEFRLPKCELFF